MLRNYSFLKVFNSIVSIIFQKPVPLKIYSKICPKKKNLGGASKRREGGKTQLKQEIV